MTMFSIYKKEINAFFSSLIGYIVIIVFLVMTGLFMWVFPDTSVLRYNFATLEQLFALAPLIFLFLIPALTMSSFAEEKQTGTIEFLSTKPLSITQIVLGKFFSYWTLVLIALIPTIIYYYSVYQLGSPKGNLDTGGIIGSYIGLVFLGGVYVAIGMWASSLTKNQIVAFILAAFFCFLFQYAFSFLAGLSLFSPLVGSIVDKLGIDNHYTSISRGVIDSRDIIYFLSLIVLFIYATMITLKSSRS